MENKVKFKLKKGDLVRVISGESKGQEGKILSIDTKKHRVLVEGVNMISKHSKPSAKKRIASISLPRPARGRMTRGFCSICVVVVAMKKLQTQTARPTRLFERARRP